MTDESVKIYELAILEYPESFQLYYSYAELLTAVDDEKALDLYRKCVELYDNNPDNKEYGEEYENVLKMIEEKE